MPIPPRAREAFKQIGFTEEQLLVIEANFPAADVVLSQMKEGEEVKVGADIVVRKENGEFYLVGPTRKRKLLYEQAEFFVAYGLVAKLIPPEKYGLHREGPFLLY